jgi:hypothetical protein
VTAKHLIVDVQRKSIDGMVWLRANDRSGGSILLESKPSNWVDHPEDSSVDASVLPWAPPSDEFEYRSIPDNMTATPKVIKREGIGPGDEVFLTGLFVNHVGRNRNLPIVRMGNIALMPEERIATRHFGSIEAYLVEARSIGGLSGSPVFVHLTGTRPVGEGFKISGTRFFWLGLMHGHWDLPVDQSSPVVAIADTPEKEAVNMGIAIVVPSTKIMEIVNQPVFRDHREQELKRRKESNLPTLDNADYDAEEEVPT